MKLFISFLLSFNFYLFAGDYTWTNVDVKGTSYCKHQETQTMPLVCNGRVSVTMKTEVQCFDGSLKPVVKTKYDLIPEFFLTGRQGSSPIQVNSSLSEGITDFSVNLGEGQTFQGSIEFKDSDARVECNQDGFVDSRDLIPAGDFESDAEYPAIGDARDKAFRFDNYSGGGWCEKQSDFVLQESENIESFIKKNLTCRDFNYDPMVNGEFIPSTARYGILPGSGDPDGFIGDGYSLLFPGGEIRRESQVGYRYSGASLHKRTTFVPNNGSPDISPYEKIEGEFVNKYEDQGRVEIVARDLQNEIYTMTEGQTRWYGLSFKLVDDDILGTYTFIENSEDPLKARYKKNLTTTPAIIAQLHNATDKAAYFTLRKDPVNEGFFISFAHDFNCPNDARFFLFNQDLCSPPFNISGIADETVFLQGSYISKEFAVFENGIKIPDYPSYLSYNGPKYQILGNKTEYFAVTSRTQRFSEFKVEPDKWYHIRYKLTAQNNYHDGIEVDKDVIGRISAQIREDSETWQDFKLIHPKKELNTVYSLFESEACSNGLYRERYHEPLDSENTNISKARTCHTEETEATVFTHSHNNSSDNLKNSFKFGWYGKTLTKQINSSSILIDNVSASPLKKGLKKPLREDPLFVYDFKGSPQELIPISTQPILTEEDDGILIENLSYSNNFDLKSLFKLENDDIEELKVEVVLSIPNTFNENAQNYRGNIQLLSDYQWLGQFDLWVDRNYAQYNPNTNSYYYIAEFRIPNRFFKYSPAQLKLVVNRMNGFDSFKIHSLSFYEMESYKNRNLNGQLLKLANRFATTKIDILASAKSYDQFNSVESQFNIWYRDLVDVDVDGIEKRFYFMIGQDVVYKMGGVYPWASLSGYQPLIPWQTTSFTPWRQIWTYLGNEAL